MSASSIGLLVESRVTALKRSDIGTSIVLANFREGVFDAKISFQVPDMRASNDAGVHLGGESAFLAILWLSLALVRPQLVQSQPRQR